LGIGWRVCFFSEERLATFAFGWVFGFGIGTAILALGLGVAETFTGGLVFFVDVLLGVTGALDTAAATKRNRWPG
jgi:hypothetical protein